MVETFLRTSLSLSRRRDLTGSAKRLYGLLQFRQGQNEVSWWSIRSLAVDLGVSERTIQRTVKKLVKAGGLEVEWSRGGRGRKGKGRTNRYRVKNGDILTPLEAGNGDRMSGLNGDILTPEKIKRRKGKEEIWRPPAGLSAVAHSEVLLCEQRVAPGVAVSLARQHSPEAIRVAIYNAVSKAEPARRRGEDFNLPGYIVASLNDSAAEGRPVRPNAIVRHNMATADQRAARQRRQAETVRQQARDFKEYGDLAEKTPASARIGPAEPAQAMA